LQKEVSRLETEVVSRGRELEKQSQWSPVRIVSATASVALAAQWETSELERKLANLKLEKLTPKKEKEQRKGLLEAIADERKKAKSQAGRVRPLQISDGDLHTGSEISGAQAFDLTANADVSRITALRIEVYPTKSEIAQHSPELGFIVDRIDAWVIGSDGQQKKIVFRSLIPDSESGLDSAVNAAIESRRDLTDDPEANGFQTVPNLFHTRWLVGVLAEPLKLRKGSRIK